MAEEIRKNIDPYHDPNVFTSLPNEFEEIVRSIGYKHQSCIPGIVEEYDRESHLAKVRPLVKYTDYNDKSTERPAVTVGVLRWQMGGFLIDAPVFVGEVGWIVAADRNTQNAKMMNAKIQEKDTCKVDGGKIDYGDGNQGPQTSAQPYEMHKWQHGFFIPDSWASIKVKDEYKDKLLIQTVDKNGEFKGRIALSRDGEIEIQSDERLSVNADTHAYGDLKLLHDGKKDPETGEPTGGRLVVEGKSDFCDKIVVKKTITVTVKSEETGGNPTEKEVEATVIIDPADLFDEPDSEMRIREKTIVTGAEDTSSGGKILKTWVGRVLVTEGKEGEDIPLPQGGGGGGDVTITGTDTSSHAGSSFRFASATDSNVKVVVGNDGSMTVSVYYV